MVGTAPHPGEPVCNGIGLVCSPAQLTACRPALLTAPQLRQRVGEDASAKGSSSKGGSSKSSSSKAAPEEDDSGYQDAQDALEEMIEEVG